MEYGIDETHGSRRVWRGHWAYLASNGDKPAYLSMVFTMEAGGALSQIGDASARVDRVRQKELAGMQGVTRSTVTKRIGRWSAPEKCPKCGKAKIVFVNPDWLRCVSCQCEFEPSWTAAKRQQASQKMKDICAVHPHWQGGASQLKIASGTVADVGKVGPGTLPPSLPGAKAMLPEGVQHGPGAEWGIPPVCNTVVPLIGGSASADKTLRHDEQAGPGGAAESEPGETRSSCRSPLPAGKRHVGCILTRNAGFNVANSYSLAIPEAARPTLKGDPDPTAHAKILASHFGDHVYDPTARVNGFRRSWPWNFDPRLPDAPDCECRRQKDFEFQQQCPKCEGKGFTIGGSMSDSARVLLHWMNDRGIDEGIRRCNDCQRSYSQDQARAWPKCPGCGREGVIAKPRGVLGGPGSKGCTQKEIAETNGMHVSTVRRCFRVFQRLRIIRVVYGKLWRKCCGVLYDEPQCPKCGNKCGAISHRDPWKLLFLPSRTFDKELVQAEKQRLEALVRWHRRFLDAGQQKRLEAAVELTEKVLGEWCGKEHQLLSFYHEMRRRLFTHEFKRFINVLFPLAQLQT